ncbi:MAG: hypothetical protein U0105_08905 [Candidatus Obscuribacterales bacterium]
MFELLHFLSDNAWLMTIPALIMLVVSIVRRHSARRAALSFLAASELTTIFYSGLWFCTYLFAEGKGVLGIIITPVFLIFGTFASVVGSAIVYGIIWMIQRLRSRGHDEHIIEQ